MLEGCRVVVGAAEQDGSSPDTANTLASPPALGRDTVLCLPALSLIPPGHRGSILARSPTT